MKMGDILYSSWGYDQTNIDFYQVTKVMAKSVMIAQIKSDMPKGEEGFMTGKVIPVKDAFVGAPMLKKITKSGGCKIASYAWAGPWDGKPKSCSWYA